MAGVAHAQRLYDALAALPDDQRFEVVPDWICEVLSPSTVGKDREIKMPVYAAYGVSHAWLVDPRARTVEVYVRDGNSWMASATFRDDAPIQALPFDAAAHPASSSTSGRAR